MIVRFLQKFGRLGDWVIIRKIRCEAYVGYLGMKRRKEIVIWTGRNRGGKKC